MGGGIHGYTCAVLTCNNTTVFTKGVSFFRFPKDPERAEIWLKACQRHMPISKLYNNYRVCGQHFAPPMFLNNLKNRLQTHAAPVINISKKLGSSSDGDVITNVLQNVREELDESNVSLRQIPKGNQINAIDEDKASNFNGDCSTSYNLRGNQTNYEDKQTENINKILDDKKIQVEAKLSNHSPRKKRLRLQNMLLMKKNKNL